MNWDITNIIISGDKEFLQSLEKVIDECNDESKYIYGQISTVLGRLHINSREYRTFNYFFEKASFNKYDQLVIRAVHTDMTKASYADILMSHYPDKISGINYVKVFPPKE